MAGGENTGRGSFAKGGLGLRVGERRGSGEFAGEADGCDHGRGIGEGDLYGGEADYERGAGEEHAEFLSGEGVGEELCLAREREADGLEAFFGNRSGDGGCRRGLTEEAGGLHERVEGGPGGGSVGFPEGPGGAVANYAEVEAAGSWPDARAASMTSGPIPAGSPSVMSISGIPYGWMPNRVVASWIDMREGITLDQSIRSIHLMESLSPAF